MPTAAAQAAMAQAAVSMAACTRVVPETPLAFPQSLVPGFSLGAPRAGHYRGAMAASVVSLPAICLLILGGGYVLQRFQPETASGEAGVFLRSLTAAMAPGTMFAVVAFNVDPVVGAAAALLQIGESYAVDAPVAVCGVALLGLCVGYTWRAVRDATDPRSPVCCIRFDPAARVVPPFKSPPLGCLTFAVLRWWLYGTGAWVDVDTASADTTHPQSSVADDDDELASWRPPTVRAAGRRLRTVIGALRGESHVLIKQQGNAEFVAAAPRSVRATVAGLLPATEHYVFFALGCTACTSVLRSVRFSCAAQLWLLLSVQCCCLYVLLARAPYAVPAKNAVSVATAAATGAALLCLALDAALDMERVKLLGQAIAVAASMLSYPTLAITVGRRAILVVWLHRQHRRRVGARSDNILLPDDELIKVALLDVGGLDEAPVRTALSPEVAALAFAVPPTFTVTAVAMVEPSWACPPPPLLVVADGAASEGSTGDASLLLLSGDDVGCEVDGNDPGDLRFTHHTQDGADQVDDFRANPLRRPTTYGARRSGGGVLGSVHDLGVSLSEDADELRRRRAAMAAAAIAAADADASLLL
jgi:hypothetical protein